jgi:hypothetical protein
MLQACKNSKMAEGRESSLKLLGGLGLPLAHWLDPPSREALRTNRVR